VITIVQGRARSLQRLNLFSQRKQAYFDRASDLFRVH
jgi:hypothetical protein